MLAELDWLQDPPPDFRKRLKAVRQDISTGAADIEARLYELALNRLDVNQLTQLSNSASAYMAAEPGLGSLARVKLGIIGAGTLDLLAPAISASALRHRVLATVLNSEYGSAVQDALNANSAIRAAGLDMVAVLPDHRMVGLDKPRLAPGGSHEAVTAAMSLIRNIVEGLESSVAGVLVANIPPPVEPLFGSFDAAEPGSVHAMVTAFNADLAEWAATKGVVLIDMARTAAWVGLDRWHDAGHWNASKLPFNPDLIPLYADIVGRSLAAVRGVTRKCLVLDLDNTCWGGVIGDDGIDGIELGQGSARGEAFLAIQQAAMNLRERGIILAVCSKNTDEIARGPFRQHPEMIIKEDHVAVFMANWGDKATNLRAIASALNIGLDALVFLDDNPAERAQVRRELPMVAVPELPDDPALYSRALLCAGYFDAVSFAQEDRDRADAYRANVERAAFAGSSDMAGYLISLDMVADLRPFDAVNRARIAQLINKSNQFNLTTRRYTEKEIAAMEANPDFLTLQVRLDDRFGANGMISVIIVNRRTWEIDTWLMSCRVLGRRVEEAALAQLVEAARHAGAVQLTGRYVPTAKNGMVAAHYANLGFAQIESDAGNETVWRLELAAYAPPKLPLRIESTVAGLT